MTAHMLDITVNDELQGLLDSYEQCFLAMGLLLKNQLPMPTLILLYTVIDGLSWLASISPSISVRKRYCKWVREWLLPEHSFDCRAIDFYAARCGVLHTLTYESDLYSKGEANPIAYSFGDADATILRNVIGADPHLRLIIVNIDELIQAARIGGAKFLVHAYHNPQMSGLLMARAQLFFMQLDHSYHRVDRRAIEGGNADAKI